MKYKGIAFPRMFNAGTKTSNVVGKEDNSVILSNVVNPDDAYSIMNKKKSLGPVEKISSDIRLLLNQQVREILFNPALGVDLESILFADDPLVTRDFIYSFVNEAIAINMEDVVLKDVVVKKDGTKVTAYLYFQYQRGAVNFNMDMDLKGVEYE